MGMTRTSHTTRTDTLTLDALTEGTVFTFAEDPGFMGAFMASRRPGVHFIVGRLSESGYTFSAYNTTTQRWEDMMAEGWVFESTRVIGHFRPDQEVEGTDGEH